MTADAHFATLKGMNKDRLETLVDGVFAIVMTLLVLSLQLPSIPGAVSSVALWEQLVALTPDFFSYFASFTVLAMYWTTHQAFYSYFIKSVDRLIIQLNLLYLAFLAFLPFSAHLVATHFTTPLAFIVYGCNLLAISGTQIFQIFYAIRAHEVEVDHTELDRRTYAQVIIRQFITPVFAVFGMAASFVSPHLALLLFALPIAFNIVPGGIDFLERTFHIPLPS
jgi:uncharacterized membrane protein